LRGVVGAGLQRPHVEVGRLRLLAELLPERLFHLPHVDAEEVREHAVVDHVLDEAAELGVGADRGDDLVERHRIEREVGAQLVELERLVVEHRAPRPEQEHVFLRGFRIHRDEEVDLPLSRDEAVLVRPDRVPRGQARDVRRKHVLARYRNPHLEDGAQEHEIRRLAAGPVDGGDLDAEIVYDTLLHYALSSSLTAAPMSAGLFTTRTPAADSASIFSAAVPFPPAMMAPACPMRRPGGAVWPAMNPTTGFLKCALIQAAASCSALPPISPIITTA